ncbi:MAG: MraY family glycosyltransferase [Parahaliea sp.]
MLLLSGLTVVLSALGCWAYLLLARRWHLLDHPNHRSSHQVPTPHGGGTIIVLSLALGFVAGSFVLPWTWSPVLLLILILALLLMLLGVLDDIRSLSVRLRFSIYGLSCLLAVWFSLQPITLIDGLYLLPVSFAVLWLLNLYNFMDGIDGLAALQCIGACAMASLLACSDDYALFCVLLACAHLGFLVWNFPPARLFMGDAGSVPTGFLVAALALYGQTSGALSVAVWLILLAGFIVDASTTLLRRWCRGENIFQAHRDHFYQRLSRHWQSHKKVDIAFVILLFGWLLPLAWCAQTYQSHALFPVILAYLPLFVVMAKTRDLT